MCIWTHLKSMWDMEYETGLNTRQGRFHTARLGCCTWTIYMLSSQASFAYFYNGFGLSALWSNRRLARNIRAKKIDLVSASGVLPNQREMENVRDQYRVSLGACLNSIPFFSHTQWNLVAFFYIYVQRKHLQPTKIWDMTFSMVLMAQIDPIQEKDCGEMLIIDNVSF